MLAGILFIGQKLWTWEVVSAGSIAIFFTGGVSAIYGDDLILATCLFFIAIVWIAAKAVSWEEVKGHKDRAWISVLIIVIAATCLYGSMKWIQHRAEKPVTILPLNDRPLGSSMPVAGSGTTPLAATSPKPVSRTRPVVIPSHTTVMPATVPSVPATVNNAPNGIAISGGSVTSPTVNNNYAERIPVILGGEVVTKETPGINNFPNFPALKSNSTTVEIHVDVAWNDPKIAVVCDRPCHALDVSTAQIRGLVIKPNFGSGTIPNRPEVSVFILYFTLQTAIDYLLTVQSDDDKPIRILSIQRLIIAPKQP